MTIKNEMAEGSQQVKRQKTAEPDPKDDVKGPSNRLLAEAIKLSTTSDINMVEPLRTDSDDEPTEPLPEDEKLSEEDLDEWMKPPSLDKKKKKHKKKSSKDKPKEEDQAEMK